MPLKCKVCVYVVHITHYLQRSDMLHATQPNSSTCNMFQTALTVTMQYAQYGNAARQCAHHSSLSVWTISKWLQLDYKSHFIPVCPASQVPNTAATQCSSFLHLILWLWKKCKDYTLFRPHLYTPLRCLPSIVSASNSVLR